MKDLLVQNFKGKIRVTHGTYHSPLILRSATIRIYYDDHRSIAAINEHRFFNDFYIITLKKITCCQAAYTVFKRYKLSIFSDYNHG